MAAQGVAAPASGSLRVVPAVDPPFIGRTAITEGVLRAVQQPGRAGAVIIGASGLGKTALLQHVQRALPDAYIVRVRGLQTSTSSPYRSLSFLLSELPTDVAGHPALAFNAVSAMLREEAAGRRVIFAVDNGEYLDQQSSCLIGQLVTADRARVIMTVADFALADPAFMAMWRNGSLERFELLTLTLEEASRFIEAELGAPVSREAVERIWSLAGGNPQLTRSGVRGLVQRGVLARRGGAYVLLPGAVSLGAEMIGGFSVLRSLSASQRRLAGLIALSGSLTWAQLLHLADVEDLDRLQVAGILVVRSASEATVSFARSSFSDAVAETVGAEEAAALYGQLCTLPDARFRLQGDPPRHVGWLLKAGLEVEEDDAVRAGRALNSVGEYSRVLDLVQRLRERVPSLPLAYEGLTAALGLGDLRAATMHAARLGASVHSLEPELWTRYKIAESRLLRMRAMGDPTAPLNEITDRLTVLAQQPDPVKRECLLRIERLLVAAQADLASFEGRFRINLDTLPPYIDMSLLSSPNREDREFQVTVQALLLEALAAADQQFAAADLAQSLVPELGRLDVSFPVADTALLRVEIAFLVAGGWTESARLLGEVHSSSNRWSLRLGSIAQLSEGLLLMAQDRPRDAARLLVPVVEQLRIADPHGLFPVAASALVFCHSQNSDIEQLIAHLPVGEAGRGSSWVIRRAAGHYQLLSTAGIENRKVAARTFHERAKDDRERGAGMWALIALSSAVRLGRQEAVEDLGRAAGEVQGPLAAVCMQYAEGLVTGAMPLVVRAMEGAVAAGNHRFAVDIAQSGIRVATRTQDKSGLRLVQRRLRELVPDATYFGVTGGGLENLTAREREVAALAAAGTSNRAIAEKMFVSVRTVEGHLYQVYSKLNVSTRAELAEIVPADSGR